MTDRDPDYRKPTWAELNWQRWRPSLRRSEPGIDIPADLRTRVMCLPPNRWLAWRRRSLQILTTLGHLPITDAIRAADRQAAEEILAEIDASHPKPVSNTEKNSEGESTETESKRE
jgi:hypothetical protein